MFLQFVGVLWKAVAPGLADHLWQSTLFAAVAALLTLALRRNSARLRYAIWLVASLKFLVPSSVLVITGSLFSWRHVPVSPASGVYLVEVVGQPFTRPLTSGPAAVVAPAAPATLTQFLPLFLGLWIIGVVGVLAVWMVRWRRVAVAMRNSRLLSQGREYSTLRRLEQLQGATVPVRLMQSDTPLEPGVFGILRPVLLWPRSVSEHLDDAHLEAVIAHELCHVRRRDNLAAAAHMLVEAIFWFHPLVWWIGAQLVAERERACDEAVLELGSHRHTYAESILKVCEFCLTSPLTCVSGVTGADLKKRMVHIMTDRVVRKLNFARRLLLWTAAGLAVALPIGFGLLNVTPSRAESQGASIPKFSSVSIKQHAGENNGFVMSRMKLLGTKETQSEFEAVGASPHMLLRASYEIQETQLVGEPEWTRILRYDISAKVDQQVAEQLQKLPENQRGLMNQAMMRQLLADYFKLSIHQDSREQPVYELVVGDGGSKMQKTGTEAMTRLGIGEMDAKGAPLSILCTELSQRLGRTVVDKTGLQGTFSFNLHWTPDADEMARMRAITGLKELPPLGVGNPASPGSGPDLITAVQDQLGLKLQPTTERVPVLVVDHMEQPAQN